MTKSYRIQLAIQTREEPSEPWKKAAEPVELARFETLEEATIFRTEVEQKYCAMATGEATLAEEMSSAQDFTAGD